MRIGIATTIILAGIMAMANTGSAQNLPPLLRPSATVAQVPTLRTSPDLSAVPPRLRPGSTPAVSAQQTNVVATTGIGTICGDRTIRGQKLRPIQGAVASCQIGNPVRVQSINGVALEPAVVMTCETAKATKTWLNDSAIPAWGRLGGGLSKIDVSASFTCSAASGQAAHQIGTAIDVSRFHLKNGLNVSVESGWRDPVAGKVLRDIHKGGCKAFKNASGPDAGAQTRDHLHFDIASGRGRCR